MRLGLFGGSFDPVHLGHIELAKKALVKLKLDQLIFIPTPQNPLKKNSPLASNHQRVEMLKLAIAEEDRFLVSEAEVGSDCQQQGPAYSIDTVIYFAGLHQLNKDQLFFIMGTDSVALLHNWKDYDQLFTFCTIVVFGRENQNAEDLKRLNPNLSLDQIQLLQRNFIQFDFPCSSSSVRKAILDKNRQATGQQLQGPVINYIKSNLLYGWQD